MRTMCGRYCSAKDRDSSPEAAVPTTSWPNFLSFASRSAATINSSSTISIRKLILYSCLRPVQFDRESYAERRTRGVSKLQTSVQLPYQHRHQAEPERRISVHIKFRREAGAGIGNEQTPGAAI